MYEIIKVNYENPNRPVVSGRELHKGLEVKTSYKDWFPRMCAYGFEENRDYSVTLIFEPNSNGGKQSYTDHAISIDMAKEICMIQRSEKGKQFRQYFIDIEKQWNTPEAVMARALQMANLHIENLKSENNKLIETVTEYKPKVQYHDNVLRKENLISTTLVAKDLGLKSAQALNKVLNKNKIIYKQGNKWIPYSAYEWLIKENYADYISYEDKNSTPMLKWTEKGRKWIVENINDWKVNS